MGEQLTAVYFNLLFKKVITIDYDFVNYPYTTHIINHCKYTDNLKKSL